MAWHCLAVQHGARCTVQGLEGMAWEGGHWLLCICMEHFYGTTYLPLADGKKLLHGAMFKRIVLGRKHCK